MADENQKSTITVRAIDTVHDNRISHKHPSVGGALHRGQLGETSSGAAKELSEAGFVEIVSDKELAKTDKADKKKADPDNKMVKSKPENKKKK